MGTKLYVWQSRALSDYTLGSIVVCASSPNVARKRAWKEWEINQWVSREDLEADLAKEPEVQETGAILICGGS